MNTSDPNPRGSCLKTCHALEVKEAETTCSCFLEINKREFLIFDKIKLFCTFAR